MFGSFCPACGTTLDADAAFCPKCGASVKGGAPAARGGGVYQAPVAAPAPRTSVKNRVFSKLANVFGIIGLFLCWIPVVGMMLSGVGFVFSLIGKGGMGGRVCGIIGAILGFILTVVILSEGGF